MLLALLGGCLSSITNSAFYEDEVFLEVLPDVDLLPPVGLLSPASGDALMYGTAVRRAGELGGGLWPLIATGGALREAAPDVRDEQLRSWHGVNVSAVITHLDGTQHVAYWFVDAEVVRVGELRRWTISGTADSASADPVELASGVVDGEGHGQLVWDLTAFAQLVEADWIGVIHAELDKTLALQRDNTFVYESSSLVRWYRVMGEARLAWSDAFDFVGDDPVPGVAIAVHDPQLGGRAEGLLDIDGQQDEVRDFLECWDDKGQQLVLALLDDASGAGAADGCSVAIELIP